VPAGLPEELCVGEVEVRDYGEMQFSGEGEEVDTVLRVRVPNSGRR
jgi:hypothetical protein